MIRHRPFGSGHPYRIEPDQRVPVVLIAHEPFELRATTNADVGKVQVEVVIDGRRRVLNAQPLAHDSLAATSTGASASHLLGAAEGKAPRRVSWVARPDPLPPGTWLRYRFIAEGKDRTRRTAWFSASSASWTRDSGQLSVEVAGRLPVRDRLIEGSLAWLAGPEGPTRARFALRLEDGEHVIGFGERFDALDQRGRRLDAVVYEQYKQQGARTYLPMPFAIVAGERGWGFHVATSRRTWFDVGVSERDRVWVEAALDPQAPDRGALLVQLFQGSPGEVLGAFLERTGRPKLPPSWVFRPWMSSNEWNTQARVQAEVERTIAEQIPAGVVVIEAWSDESTFVAFRDAEYPVHQDGSPHRLADFQFPPDGAWPDPKGMVDELHAQGIKVLLWQVPLLKARPQPASQAHFDQQAMVTSGHVVREANGRPYRNRGWWFRNALMPDFTSDAARDWWLAKRRYLVEEIGIDGFKTDGGEHAWGDDLRYADGSRGDLGNNRYPVAYAGAYHQLLADAGRDGVTFSRAGFTGSAAHPCHWAGDEDSTWEAFRASITAGLTAGACGIFFWGWDLGGFSGEIPSAELYLRAAAAACCSPIMQYHSEFNFHRSPSRDRTPWNIAERTGDAGVMSSYQRFATLRESLVPYLWAQAATAVGTSKPLMRALFFEESEDSEIWKWPYQFFLGDALLVAPVTQPGARSWQLYLPAGDWVDVWSGQQHSGRCVIERLTPLDEIPVYVRSHWAGELLPIFRSAQGFEDLSYSNAGGKP